MKETKVKLDRWRTLRLTPYSIKRGEQEFGSLEDLGKRLQTRRLEDDIIRAVWALLVDEDPELTPAAVKEILERAFLRGPLWLRDRRFSQLLAKVGRFMDDTAASLGMEG